MEIKFRIEQSGISGQWLDRQGLDRLPSSGGAYLIALLLSQPITLQLVKKEPRTLNPAWYIYCGSAYGSGGLASRIKRHFRHRKPIHWHIDRLTVEASQLWTLCVEQGDECNLTTTLDQSKNFDHPIPGFGSTDCRLCKSHLLMHRAAISEQSN